MTIVKHELRQGKVSFWVWTISIAFLMAVCICLFPEGRVHQILLISGCFHHCLWHGQTELRHAHGLLRNRMRQRVGAGRRIFCRSVCCQHSQQRRKGTHRGIPADASRKPHTYCHRKTCCSLHSDRGDECDHLRRFRRNDHSHKRAGSLERPEPASFRIYHHAGGARLHLLCHLSLYKKKRRRDRTWNCCHHVFSEHHSQYIEISSIPEIHHALRVLRRG